MNFAARCFRPSVLSGCLLAVGGTLAWAAEKPLFEEKFAGRLADGWTWIDELPGTWKVVDGALELQVVPVGEGLWESGRKHPNLLVRDPAVGGDFAVEVQLTSQPTSQFEHGGLILYADGDNYVVLNKEMLGKPAIVMVAEKGAKPDAREKPYEHEAVCLRLAVVGKKVTSQYRHYDSDAWQTLGELELPVPGPYKVGLLAGQPPKDADHRVRFSQFRILAGSAAGADVAASSPPVAAAKPATPTAEPPVPSKRPIRADVPLAVQARLAAEQAIPYIEKEGTAWIKDRKCVTCHYVGYMVWSFHDARQRGFGIDPTQLAQWTDWSLAHAVGQGAEGPAQVLLARDRSDPSEKTAQQVAALGDAILKSQDKDGFWKPGGQLPAQKRPLSETTQVSTMLCVLGLDTLEQPGEAATDDKARESHDKVIESRDRVIESRDRALAWLNKTPPNGQDPAVSSEWYAMRLAIDKKFGEPAQVAALRDKILAAQQSDGGWGWLWADKSDAFGTGLALYALSEAGVPSSDPAIERAWKFLIETQTDNGSWVVSGTKKETKDKPHPFSSFWGSTWALLGLSKSLPDSALKAAAGPSPPGTSAAAVAASGETAQP